MEPTTITDLIQSAAVRRELFRCLGLGDIKNCRLVSQSWYDASLSRFRDISVINIDIGDSQKVKHRVKLEEILALVNNTDDPLNLKENPIRNIQLQECDYPSRVPFGQLKFGPEINSISVNWNITSEDMNLFLGRLNEFPKLKKLTLYINNEEIARHSCSLPPQGPWFEAITSVQNVHKKLKELKLVVCLPKVPFGPGLRQSGSWANLFDRFPNLNSLTLKSDSVGRVVNDEQEFIEDILDAIKMIRDKNPSALNISYLNFYDLLDKKDVAAHYVQTVFLKLSKLNLPLETVKCFTIGPHMVHTTPMVQAYANSLKTLYISTCGQYSFDDQDLLLDTFPNIPLPELIELATTSTDFKFVQYTPKLRKLTVKLWATTNQQSMTAWNSSGASLNFPFLTDLVLISGSIIQAEDLRVLARWMPAVKSLYISLTDELLPVLIEGWPGLRNLTIIGNYLTDKGVTGFCHNAENKLDICSEQGLAGLQSLRSLDFQNRRLSTIVYSLDRLPCLEYALFPKKAKRRMEKILGGKDRHYTVKYE